MPVLSHSLNILPTSVLLCLNRISGPEYGPENTMLLNVVNLNLDAEMVQQSSKVLQQAS